MHVYIIQTLRCHVFYQRLKLYYIANLCTTLVLCQIIHTIKTEIYHQEQQSGMHDVICIAVVVLYLCILNLTFFAIIIIVLMKLYATYRILSLTLQLVPHFSALLGHM